MFLEDIFRKNATVDMKQQYFFSLTYQLSQNIWSWQLILSVKATFFNDSVLLLRELLAKPTIHYLAKFLNCLGLQKDLNPETQKLRSKENE